MKKADVVIIVALLVIAAIVGGTTMLLNNHKYGRIYADIYVKNKLYKSVLIKDKKFKDEVLVRDDLGMNLISIYNGGVKIIDADCRDKICVKTGFVNRPGQSLVCLPHKLVVELKGESKAQDNAETDEVSY